MNLKDPSSNLEEEPNRIDFPEDEDMALHQIEDGANGTQSNQLETIDGGFDSTEKRREVVLVLHTLNEKIKQETELNPDLLENEEVKNFLTDCEEPYRQLVSRELEKDSNKNAREYFETHKKQKVYESKKDLAERMTKLYKEIKTTKKSDQDKKDIKLYKYIEKAWKNLSDEEKNSYADGKDPKRAKFNFVTFLAKSRFENIKLNCKKEIVNEVEKFFVEGKLDSQGERLPFVPGDIMLAGENLEKLEKQDKKFKDSYVFLELPESKTGDAKIEPSPIEIDVDMPSTQPAIEAKNNSEDGFNWREINNARKIKENKKIIEKAFESSEEEQSKSIQSESETESTNEEPDKIQEAVDVKFYLEKGLMKGSVAEYEDLLEKKDRYKRLLQDKDEKTYTKEHQKELNGISKKIQKYEQRARYAQEDYAGTKEYYEDEKREIEGALQQERFDKDGNAIENPNQQSIDRLQAQIDKLEKKINPSWWNPKSWLKIPVIKQASWVTKKVSNGIKWLARRAPITTLGVSGAVGISSGVLLGPVGLVTLFPMGAYGMYRSIAELSIRHNNGETIGPVWVNELGSKLFGEDGDDSDEEDLETKKPITAKAKKTPSQREADKLKPKSLSPEEEHKKEELDRKIKELEEKGREYVCEECGKIYKARVTLAAGCPECEASPEVSLKGKEDDLLSYQKDLDKLKKAYEAYKQGKEPEDGNKQNEESESKAIVGGPAPVEILNNNEAVAVNRKTEEEKGAPATISPDEILRILNLENKKNLSFKELHDAFDSFDNDKQSEENLKIMEKLYDLAEKSIPSGTNTEQAEQAGREFMKKFFNLENENLPLENPEVTKENSSQDIVSEIKDILSIDDEDFTKEYIAGEYERLKKKYSQKNKGKLKLEELKNFDRIRKILGKIRKFRRQNEPIQDAIYDILKGK